jgi:hypothetical protein
VAFQDWGNSRKATVMKFDVSNWINVGNPGFSIGVTTWISLAFNQSGQPLVSFVDDGNSRKASVMYFDVRCTGMSTNLHYTRVFAYVSIFFVEYSLTLPQSIPENHFFLK